ncbi:LacI family transcriptional regulator [Streptomyces sp. NBC_01341]|uniref:LacI family DNA-binding transcriptional regulator n=1 Tax=Streptomyces sp. NBC_01341 TaxID=2903831 RepID=UPI002E1466F1|nr:LacI family transcriptional regulator [Streptomyces sp. NBC_01341]
MTKKAGGSTSARRTARIQDVAALAGVSVATVSNVLNRPGRVTAQTSERVLRAVRELDYVAHPGAVGLRSGRVRALGLVVPDIVNSFYARIAGSAADAAYERGYSLTLCHSGDDPEREQSYFDMLANQRSAGVIVVPVAADPGRLARLRRRGIPLVTTDRAGSTADGCSVAVDDVRGGRTAVEQLLAHRGGQSGGATVVVVNGSRDIQQCADRYRGAEEAVRDRPGVRLVEVTVQEMTLATGAAVARTLATAPEPPVGVFCTNDFLAAGLVRGLLEYGVQVPADIRVAGFGDLDVAMLSGLPLTTVRQSVEDLGRTAVELLLDEVEAPPGEHTHASRVFAPTLVVRDSAP